MAGFQPFSCSPNWPLNAVNPDGSIPEIKWDEAFECYRVNGVLAPKPLSYALPVHASSVPMDILPMDIRSDNKRTLKRAPGSPSSSGVNVGISEPPTGSSMGESSRKRSADHPMLFKLHKFVDRVEEYLLQVHEPTCSTTHYHNVKVYEDDKGKWAMKVVATTEPRNHEAVQAWLVDPTPPFFEKRSNLDFQQRLSGWTMESRPRKNFGREDKFYYHKGKQYKSFVQVLTFVLYANKDLKDLKANNALVPGLEEGGGVQPQHENADGTAGVADNSSAAGP